MQMFDEIWTKKKKKKRQYFTLYGNLSSLIFMFEPSPLDPLR